MLALSGIGGGQTVKLPDGSFAAPSLVQADNTNAVANVTGITLFIFIKIILHLQTRDIITFMFFIEKAFFIYPEQKKLYRDRELW